MQTSNIIICRGYYNSFERIVVFIPKQEPLIDKIKQLHGRRWCPTHKCWHFPYSDKQWKYFKQLFKNISYQIDESKVIELPILINQSKNATKKLRIKQIPPISSRQQEILINFEQQLTLERKSYATIKSYKQQLLDFMRFYENQEINTLDKSQIEKYLLSQCA